MDKSQFRILVIDDEVGMCDGISRALSIAGFNSDVCYSGKEGVQKIRDEDIHLAFVDLKLPDMGGVDITKIVNTEQTKIVIITAYASVDSAVNAMKYGAADYLKKPFDINEIVEIAEKFYKNKTSDTQETDLYLNDKHKIIIKSTRMNKIYSIIEKIKDQDISVLITGESGTGKEIIARMIHSLGNRKDKPFIGINCAAIPKELLESELFGFEKGAFSGAVNSKIGKFEAAEDGIIFLDEIGDMEISLQAKFLRVLEEKSFERIGSVKQIPLKARIIASTNQNLSQLIQEKKFRDDLYYRLKGISIDVPSLKERKEDIEHLINFFINHFCGLYDKENINLATETLKILKEYNWPGNVRELKNLIESAVLLCDSNKVLVPEDFSIMMDNDVEQDSFYKKEKKEIMDALEKNKFNRTLTAKTLKISRKSLYNKIKKFHIE